jgi:hypothetical protein
MRNILLGAVAGLLLGTIGALAYSHFLGDGSLLADLQAKLDAANAALAKLEQDKKELAKETSGLSQQVDQLQASNAELKKADAGPAPTAAPPPPGGDLGALAGVMRNMFRSGGFQSPQQRMLLFKTRLHLTAEQTTAIQAAMDADEKARRDLMRQAFQNGGKIDPAAAAKANTLATTLTTVLNADQQRAYAQLQTDEKTARADSSATTQIDSMMPLLQLSDSQKDQVYNALYQVQVNAPDPSSLMTTPNPMAALTSQAQATSAALAKVLSSDQMTLYQQQNQAFGGPGRRVGNSNSSAASPANNNAVAAPVTGAGTGFIAPTTTSGVVMGVNSVTTTNGATIGGSTTPPPAPAPDATAASATTPSSNNVDPNAASTNATTNAATSSSTNAPPQ